MWWLLLVGILHYLKEMYSQNQDFIYIVKHFHLLQVHCSITACTIKSHGCKIMMPNLDLTYGEVMNKLYLAVNYCQRFCANGYMSVIQCRHYTFDKKKMYFFKSMVSL